MPLGCGCLVALLAVSVPRLAIFLLWVFTDKLSIALDSFLVGLLGFLLLPYTTVFYALAYAPLRGVQGFGWFLVALGFVFDITSYLGSGDRYRRRRSSGGEADLV